MIDAPHGLQRNLLNNYPVITASALAVAAYSARDWLSEKITSIALNLGILSICHPRSMDSLLQKPELLKLPELNTVIQQCDIWEFANQLLLQPGILEHPQIEMILEKSSREALKRLLKLPGILEHPKIEIILEKCAYGSTDHFLQQPGILDHPQIEIILKKCTYGSTDHFLQQPGIFEHPQIEKILKQCSSGSANPLLQQPGIFEHPQIERILECCSYGSTDHFLEQPGILGSPQIEFILKKCSTAAIERLLKQPGIFEHPKIGIILEKCSKAAPSKRAVANLPNSVGMFSVFHYLLALMRDHEANVYPGGIEINFGNKGVYYDPGRGENWWNYYFEPVNTQFHTQLRCGVKEVQFSLGQYLSLADSIEGALDYHKGMSRSEANALFKKYFKLKSDIQAEVDRFAADHFSGTHVISVHYRGTDKTCNTGRCEARISTYEEVIAKVQEHIRKNHLESFKIFVAADEEGFIQRMQQEFPGKIAVSNARRSTDGQPLHYDSINPYQTGRDALIDCLLLAKGDVLIRTSSNLSKFATYINPNATVVEVSKRWHQDRGK